jgi:hypothetical protein
VVLTLGIAASVAIFGFVVELGAAARLGNLPLRGDPPLLPELVQRGVEGTFAHLQHVAGHLFQTLSNCPAVEGLERNDFQEQQVQGALDQVWRCAHLTSVTEVNIPETSPAEKGASEDNTQRVGMAPWHGTRGKLLNARGLRDRIFASGAEGRRFESCRARQQKPL